jgi:hypothetical protein
MQVNNFRADTRQGKTVFSANIGGVLTALQRDQYGWSVWIDSHGGNPAYFGERGLMDNPINYRPRCLKECFDHQSDYDSFVDSLSGLVDSTVKYYQDKVSKGVTLELAQEIQLYGIMHAMFRADLDNKTNQVLSFEVMIENTWYDLPSESYHQGLCADLSDRDYDPDTITLTW